MVQRGGDRKLTSGAAHHAGRPEIFTTDQGSQFTSPRFTGLLTEAGVRVSMDGRGRWMDNVFIESHFKTLKYQPEFPKRFGGIEDAKAFCRRFFIWYNQDHHHAGIGLMTPDQVHYGQADVVHAARQQTLDRAFRLNPERFVRKTPEPPAKPIAAWINPPRKPDSIQA